MELVGKFSAPHFDVDAHVIVGEPSQKHNEWVKTKILAGHEDRKQKALEFKARKKAKGASKGEKENVDGEEPPSKKPKIDEELPPPDVNVDTWYLPKTRREPDVLEKVVDQKFTEYSLPGDDEGFAHIHFIWKPKDEAEKYLTQWIVDKKATRVIANLKPSDWFLERHKAWQATLDVMRRKQKDLKVSSKEKDDGVQSEGILEISSDEDLHKLDGAGAPIYALFKPEDWTLLQWRYELHLLVQAFVSDVDDAEHTGVPTEHLAHYFKVYYKRPFHPRDLNCSKISGVVELMSETFSIDDGAKRKPLLTKFARDTQIVAFVKVVEEARRDRLRRIEAGDESARLKLAPSKGSGKGKGAGKGKKSRGDNITNVGADQQDGGKNKSNSRGEGKGGKSSKVKLAVQQRTLAKRQHEKRDRQNNDREAKVRDRQSDGPGKGEAKGKKGKSRGIAVEREWRSKNVGRFATSNSDRKRPALEPTHVDVQRTSATRTGKGTGKGGGASRADHAHRPIRGGKAGSSRSRFSDPPPRPPSLDRHRELSRHQPRHQDRNQRQSARPGEERRSRVEDRNGSKGGSGGGKGTKARPDSTTSAPLSSPHRDGRFSNFRSESRSGFRESNHPREKGGGKLGSYRSDGHSSSRQFSPSRVNSSKGDRNGKGDRFSKSDRSKGSSRNFDRRR